MANIVYAVTVDKQLHKLFSSEERAKRYLNEKILEIVDDWLLYGNNHWLVTNLGEVFLLTIEERTIIK